MKHIIFSGGLGNQMFIYALYIALRKEGISVDADYSLYNYVNMHNGYELPRVFGVKDNFVNKKGLHLILLRMLLKLRPEFLMTEDINGWNPQVFEAPKKYIYGYWQSDKYFSDYKDEIVNEFTFKGINSSNIILANEMLSLDSVSLHIRRGDYLGLHRYANICNETYYSKAIQYICDRVNNPHFYIFSNDIEWCKDFADSLGIKYTLLVHNKGVDSFQDMYLMTQCHHNIIANSSFSWWGAYLNKNPNAIQIAPKGWDNTDTSEYNAIRVPNNFIRL